LIKSLSKTSKLLYIFCSLIRNNNTEDAEEALQNQESADANLDGGNSGAQEETFETEAKDVGPSLCLPIKRLSFEVELNQVAVSMLSIHNQGSTPIQFEWEPMDKTNLFSVSYSDNAI
jgi:hypothetical protein